MENFSIEGTARTPRIDLSPSGALIIEGRSIPENSIDFYKPVMDWLAEYSKNPSAVTEFVVRLEYFNTSSSKCILDIFKRLKMIAQDRRSEVKVKWCYNADDEDMLEAGEDYREIAGIPFELSAYEQ